MTVMTDREAVCKALADELRADADVIFFGEDVAEAGGVFKVTAGLFEEFGPNRVRDTPISEQAIIGAALGAATSDSAAAGAASSTVKDTNGSRSACNPSRPARGSKVRGASGAQRSAWRGWRHARTT